MKHLKFSIFALLLQSTVLFAHDGCCDHRWWWNLGAGVGTASNDYNDFTGGAGQISFNGMITDTLFLTFEWSNVSKDLDSRDEQLTREVGLLLGYKSKRPNWFWSAAAGVGASHAKREYTTYSSYYTYRYTQSDTTVSVPVEAQLFYTPFRHFGFGLIGHASVSKYPFASAMLAIQFA